MSEFDDSRLDDPEALRQAEPWLRHLAGAGARVRVEAAAASDALARVDVDVRPRAVLAVGQEARLIRAVLEPTCPVPFVAWPSHALPPWVGPLDVVVALASAGADWRMPQALREAERRGCHIVLVAPAESPVARQAAGRGTILVPSTTEDPQAAAIAMLAVLSRLGLGPAIDAESVARELDSVARECSPFVDLAHNPAKDLALGLADTHPLVWGGSVLAARASRRVAEGLRLASGRPVLAGDLDDLLPIIDATPPRDPFADPDEGSDMRPVLVVLDDHSDDELIQETGTGLRRAAEAREVRVCVIEASVGEVVERYVRLYAHGAYGAAYLAVGLGLEAEAGAELY